MTSDKAYRQAAASFKRATTNHLREQHKGLTDGSVAQTRRMYFAAMALMRAGRKYRDAQRELFNPRPVTFTSAPGYVCGNAGCECSQRSTVTTHYRDGRI